MGIRVRKPTSPGRRFQTVSDFAEITKSKPERSLIVKKNSTGGRNAHGRKTARHRGGGHKQAYRIIDFKRTKDGVPATVAAIEYDPNRNCRIALLHYHDGEKSYILAPAGLEVGNKLENGQRAEIQVGNCLRRLLMFLCHVHTINGNPTRFWVHRHNRTFGTFVLTGQDYHTITFFNSHHRTSGARETILMNLASLSSRPTGPKIRVPRGLRLTSTSTAAFSSKRI